MRSIIQGKNLSRSFSLATYLLGGSSIPTRHQPPHPQTNPPDFSRVSVLPRLATSKPSRSADCLRTWRFKPQLNGTRLAANKLMHLKGNLQDIFLFTIWLFNSLPWKIPIFKNGKPSISMGHLYHGYVK